VRNSLRRLRKEKRLSLREAGDKMGIPFQTLANYEKSLGELPPEVIEKAAKFYDVSGTDVTQEWTDFREDSPQNRAQGLAIDLLPDDVLRLLRKIFSDLLPSSHEPATTKIMLSLDSINQELKQRPIVIKHERSRAPDPSSELTSEEKEALKTFSGRIPNEPGEPEEPSRSPGAGAPHSHKAGPSAPSSGESKPRHSAREAKGQK
jgi:transcriptional regulator with XRE-family HTH domain